MVLTGDDRNTAQAICREIGVFGPEEDICVKSLMRKEFMLIELDDRKVHLRRSGGLLFARAKPGDKREIMNNAPDLRVADTGMAMGIASTEVANEASEVVLADDNFSTMVTSRTLVKGDLFTMK